MHDLREIVNAILYVCRTGIAWAYLPHDFPPYQTVYDHYAMWEADGTIEALQSLLRGQVRVAKGRAATPTAAIIDSPSVKTSCNVSESSQGIDTGNYLGLLVMPGRTSRWRSTAERCPECRHNYRFSRNVSRLSVSR